MGTEGDIQINCTSGQFFSERYSLANGMPSMNVTNIIKNADVNMSCTDGSGKGSITYDYKAGTVKYSGTFNGESVTCTDRYKTPLPTTISDSETISNLLEEWGDDRSSPDFISSDCPTAVEGSDNAETNCHGTYIQNVHITDDNNKVHVVTTKVTLTAP